MSMPLKSPRVLCSDVGWEVKIRGWCVHLHYAFRGLTPHACPSLPSWPGEALLRHFPYDLQIKTVWTKKNGALVLNLLAKLNALYISLLLGVSQSSLVSMDLRICLTDSLNETVYFENPHEIKCTFFSKRAKKRKQILTGEPVMNSCSSFALPFIKWRTVPMQFQRASRSEQIQSDKHITAGYGITA